MGDVVSLTAIIYAITESKGIKLFFGAVIFYILFQGIIWGCVNNQLMSMGVIKPTPVPTAVPVVVPTAVPTIKPVVPTAKPTVAPTVFDYSGGVVDQYGKFYSGFGYKNILPGSNWTVPGTLVRPWGYTYYN